MSHEVVKFRGAGKAGGENPRPRLNCKATKSFREAFLSSEAHRQNKTITHQRFKGCAACCYARL